MSRPPATIPEADERTWEVFEAHLWKAVERGSVTAMKLWADLHRESRQSAADDPFAEFDPPGFGS